MSVMNLGLEALGIDVETKSVSYEYLDAVIEYSDACDQLNIVFDQFDSVVRAAQNLEAVHEVVASQGVTPALEALIGGNFKDGLSLESIEASMEGIAATIWKALVNAWNAIVNWFKKLFGVNAGSTKRLDEWIKAAKKAEKLKDPKEFDRITNESLDSIRTFVTALPTKIEKGAAYGTAETTAKLVGEKRGESVFTKYTFKDNASGLSAAIQYAEALKSAIELINKNSSKIDAACSKMTKAIDAASAQNSKVQQTEVKLENGGKPTTDLTGEKNKEYASLKSSISEIGGIVNGFLKPLTQAVSSFLSANQLAQKEKTEK